MNGLERVECGPERAERRIGQETKFRRRQKTPTENGWGFIIGGETRNRTRVRFQNQIVTHGHRVHGFDDLVSNQVGSVYSPHSCNERINGT